MARVVLVARAMRAALFRMLPMSLLAACFGGDVLETADSGLTHSSPVLLNDYTDLVGVTFASDWAGHGPVKSVRLLPCQIEMEFHDGRSLSGGYVAWGYSGVYFRGMIEMRPTRWNDAPAWAPTSDQETAEEFRMHGDPTDVWLFSWDRDRANGSYVHELHLMNVDAPGYFGETSTLWFARSEPAGGSDRSCLAEIRRTRPGLATGPDGRTAFRPTGRAIANAGLVGVYSYDDDEEVRIGPCHLSIDTRFSAPAGHWNSERGNYAAFGGEVGILDQDVSEYIQSMFTPEGQYQEPGAGPPAMTDPWWGKLLGYRREPDGSLLVLDPAAGPDGDVNHWKRTGDWQGPADTWCLPSAGESPAS